MVQLERTTPALRDRLLRHMDVGWQAVDVPTHYDPVSAPVRAWIVPRADWVTSPTEAIRKTTAPEFDPSEEVLLEGDPRPEVGGLGVVTALQDKGPNEVELAVEAPEGGWLVLADTWYPGWTAELDGRATESYPAYGVMRAVWVPAGQHTVNFSYRPTTVPIGLALTLVGLAAFAYLSRK